MYYSRNSVSLLLYYAHSFQAFVTVNTCNVGACEASSEVLSDRHTAGEYIISLVPVQLWVVVTTHPVVWRCLYKFPSCLCTLILNVVFYTIN